MLENLAEYYKKVDGKTKKKILSYVFKKKADSFEPAFFIAIYSLRISRC